MLPLAREPICPAVLNLNSTGQCFRLNQRPLTALSQLRIFFGFFAPIFIIKACVFIGALPENGIVETKCLPFDDGLLAVCRQHVST